MRAAMRAGVLLLAVAALPLCASIPRNPLSASRQSDEGFATVSFGLDRSALAESVTNEAGVLVGRTVRDIPGRKITETDIDGLDRVTRYAGGDRAVSVLRPDGVLVSNVWDAAGRLSTVRHNGTNVLSLAWRADGLLSSASNADAAVSWSCDAFGRATNETVRASNVECRVSYTLSASALPTNTVMAVGGRSPALSLGRSYDAAGRLSSLTSPAGIFRIAYDGTNGLPSVVTNAAVTAYYGYDALARVTNIVYRRSSGSVIRSFVFAYDTSGVVTQRWHWYGAGFKREREACSYDSLGRLTGDRASWVLSPFVTNTFAYDCAGNRIGASSNGWPCACACENNRLVSVSTNGAFASAVLYDAAGNVTSLVSRAGVRLALSWNTLGRLVSVATNGAFAESYAYDALGRRVSTTALAADGLQLTTTRHVYEGDRCVADTDASGSPLRIYTWGPGVDDLLAVTVCSAGATNTYYAIRDRLGTVRALVDASGSTEEEYRIDAWGVTTILNGSLRSVAGSVCGSRFMFHGGAYSAATGLYQFRARWYSPELGRWLSPDPIGLEGGLNLYEFCRNNPVNFRDPSGLWGVSFGDTLIGSGNPWLAFDSDSWGDVQRGAASALDGIIPFVDPFEVAYQDECGNVDDVYKTSRHLAAFSRDILMSGMIPNIGTWAKNPALYEIGQTTVSPTTWEIIKGMSAIDKGRYLVNAAGGNYLKAAFGTAWSEVGGTITTGLTPGGKLLVLGGFEAIDYQTRK